MDIIITSTAKIKHSLELRIIRIDKAQFLSKLPPHIIIFNFRNDNDKKYKIYLNNNIKQLEHLGYFLVKKINNNFIFIKSHIINIIDIKTIQENSEKTITFNHNNKESKLDITDNNYI
jgi:hypothetical protein